jgi:Tfp pilus assembly protein PilE
MFFRKAHVAMRRNCPPIRAHARTGASLIELLIVVAVIAVLVTVLVTTVYFVRERARHAGAQVCARELLLIGEAFRITEDRYPDVADMVERYDPATCRDYVVTVTIATTEDYAGSVELGTYRVAFDAGTGIEPN